MTTKEKATWLTRRAPSGTVKRLARTGFCNRFPLTAATVKLHFSLLPYLILVR